MRNSIYGLGLLLLFSSYGCNERDRQHASGEHSMHKMHHQSDSLQHRQVHDKHHDPRPVFHPSHEPRKAEAPFSDVVEVGNLFFLSGQIGIDNQTRELVDGGIEGETRQCMENIEAVLAQHDLDLGDVVKALVILDDMADFEAFNTVYREYLPQKPARTTFAAKGLARGAKVEIEVVAVRSTD